MPTPENTFISSVHRYFPAPSNGRRRNPYFMKNNNIYTAGIWDVWYSGMGADLWVEYKWIALPKRDTTMIDIALSDLQEDWGAERMNEGRNLAVIVGCKEGGVLFRDHEWENPISVRDFRKRIWSRPELANWIMKATNK